MWESYRRGFKAYLQLERSLADASVEAYMQDLEKMIQYLTLYFPEIGPSAVTLEHLQALIKWIGELGMLASSQSRMISGLKTFFNYCLSEQLCTSDPTELLDLPRLKRSLPDLLAFEEIEMMIAAIDHSKPEGQRNRAIVEVMYSCGLRVSEIVNLTFPMLYLEDEFL